MSAPRTPLSPPAERMPLVPALEVLCRLRRDEIVVTTMGTAREWPRLSQHPLDFHYIPSAMGHAPALALGMALARPDRQIWAFNGDGGMLMSLGVLVTIAANRAENLSLIVIHNGVYEVTGGQATAAQMAHADLAGIARAAGLPSVFQFSQLESWLSQAPTALAAPGPRFILLDVEPVTDHFHLAPPGPMSEQIRRFQAALTQT